MFECLKAMETMFEFAMFMFESKGAVCGLTQDS
jgi:hypothetical protein